MLGNFISGFFNPVTKVFDDLTLSPEEKLRLETKLAAIENELSAKVLDFQTTLAIEQRKAITAGMDGNSLQKSWRPILMVEFGVLLALDSLALLPNGLPTYFGTLFMSLGGIFMLGRSAEKVAPRILKSKQ